MQTVADFILALPPWVALLVVFVVPALESSAFVGFVFPGEIALILGGVLAAGGTVPLPAVLVFGFAGAVLGDSIGYAVGRRFGRGLLDGTVGRWVRRDHLDRAEKYLAERGGKAVFLGRFTAALRVMIPGLAGMSRLHYRTFLVFNVAGAAGWVTMSVLLGYLGGASWRRLEHIASRVGLGALALLVLLVAGGLLLRRLGPTPYSRLSRRVGVSRPVVWSRRRFPRVTAWVAARLDAATATGLGLTLLVVVAVGATWTFLGITQDVVVGDELAGLDPTVHTWVVDHRAGPLDVFFGIVTWLGSNWVLLPVLAGVAAYLVRRRHSWMPLVDILVVYGAAVLLHAIVGQLVQRPRPPRADWLVSAMGWGYPSGHTTQAVAAWLVVAFLLGVGLAPRVRTRLVVAAGLVAALVAASRVYLGVHWLTDVLGAIAMSIAVLAWWGVARRTVLVLPRPAVTPRPEPQQRQQVGIGSGPARGGARTAARPRTTDAVRIPRQRTREWRSGPRGSTA